MLCGVRGNVKTRRGCIGTIAALRSRAQKAISHLTVLAAHRLVRQTALLVALGIGSGLVHAQSYERHFGQYVVRANALTGALLPESTRRAHGIEISPDRGLLNVVVVQPAPPAKTVPAQVKASVTNLFGVTEPLDMRVIRANEGVSYVGTFTFVPGQVMRFTIEVQPEGSARSSTLQFEEHFFISRNSYGVRPAIGWM